MCVNAYNEMHAVFLMLCNLYSLAYYITTLC